MGGKGDGVRSADTCSFAGEKDGQRTGSRARPTKRESAGRRAEGRETRDAKGDAKEMTKRSNAKMAPVRDTAARNSRQFRAKLLGAGRARTLTSRRRRRLPPPPPPPLRPSPRLFNVISLPLPRLPRRPGARCRI